LIGLTAGEPAVTAALLPALPFTPVGAVDVGVTLEGAPAIDALLPPTAA
jgi:hypothetical protein